MSQPTSRSSTPSNKPLPSTSTPSPSSATKRLLHELQDHAHNPNPALLHLGPTSSSSSLLHWEAVLRGVRGTPYAGGLWLLNISVPAKYPHSPPQISFVTPICHPNVQFTTGEICLTLLTGQHWSPMYTLSATMGAIQQLLTDPSPDSPLNVDVANLYREGDLVGAEGLIRYWTAEKRWAGEGKGGWISEVRKGQSGKLGE